MNFTPATPPYRICNDVSGYDYDRDMITFNGDLVAWARQMKAEGSDAIMVGTQWPDKARAQAAAAQAAGMLFGFYLEPPNSAAFRSSLNFTVALSREFWTVPLSMAVEPGGIQSLSDLRIGVNACVVAGLQPLIYGNRGDLNSLIGTSLEFSQTCGLWLADYGMNDPANPEPPITTAAIGGMKQWLHQYNSTIVKAGRNRDHDYILFEEDDMTDQEREDLKNLVAIMGGSAKIKDNADRGNDFILGYTLEQQKLADHIAGKI